MEGASPPSLWTRISSYASSSAHVLWTAFFGCLIALRFTISPLVFVFAVASKLFSMVLMEDKTASRKTRIYSTIALASLISLLVGLSSFEIIMGGLILILYSLYPLCKGRAPFDVLHHAVRYIFIFLLGYGSLAFSNGTALLALSAIVFFTVAGELIAGVGSSVGSARSIASLLGVKRSMIAIVFLMFTGSIMASFVLNSLFEFPIQINETFIPLYLIPALALDLYLTRPLIKTSSKKPWDVFHSIRRKEVIAIVFMFLFILGVFQAGRIGTKVVVSSRDYSLDVGIRTIIAGIHNYDVPWIVFNYINESNYYYIVFHKDGMLELSLKIDGQYQRFLSSCKTPFTPFEWHNFRITVNETTVEVSLDGKYHVAASRCLVAIASNIIISSSIPKATGIWIACMYSINVNA